MLLYFEKEEERNIKYQRECLLGDSKASKRPLLR